MGYNNLTEVLADLYTTGVKHGDKSGAKLNQGDIVTTADGKGIGFVEKIGCRNVIIGSDIIGESTVQHNSDYWYSVGLNMNLAEWTHDCREFYENNIKKNENEPSNELCELRELCSLSKWKLAYRVLKYDNIQNYLIKLLNIMYKTEEVDYEA